MSPKLPTEAMIEAAMRAYMDIGYCSPEAMRAALTAALAVAPRDEAAPKDDPRNVVVTPDELSHMTVLNPAPDASPSRQPTGKYVIMDSIARERADDAYNAGLEMGARVADHAGSWRIATAIRASKRERAEARAESAILERDAAQAALRVIREALTKAEKVLDVAECVIDADAEVDAFNLVQHARSVARTALASSGAARGEETDV